MGKVIDMADFTRRIEAENAKSLADFRAVEARLEIPRFIACAQTWIYHHLTISEVAQEVTAHQSPVDRNWYSGMRWVRYFTALHDVADAARMIGMSWYADGDSARPMLHQWIEYGRQMATPAPDRKALKWKEEHAQFIGGHPNWEAAIERDRAALASRRGKAV